jgi:hypothetical protein
MSANSKWGFDLTGFLSELTGRERNTPNALDFEASDTPVSIDETSPLIDAMLARIVSSSAPLS